MLALTGAFIALALLYIVAITLKVRAEMERDRLRREVANLTAECCDLIDRNTMLHEANQGLCDQLKYFMVPLPGEERVEGERWNLN